MTIHTDAGFSTGLYTVTRPGVGSWVDSRFVRVASTTFSIDAAEFPGSEGSSETTQGTEASDTRTLFTDSELRPALPSPPSGGDTGVGQEADLVTIDGDLWIVRKVDHFKALSGHYRVTVERLYRGQAT